MKDLLLILATWRLSHLIAKEHEPTGILMKLRYKAGVRYDEHNEMISTNMLSKGILCMWCNSIWLGWFVALVAYRKPFAVFYGLAYSSGAILIQEALEHGQSQHRNAS